MKPLLPAIDIAGRIREAEFALLYQSRRPVEVANLAASVGIDLAAAETATNTLAEAGWLDRDVAGRVTGAAGLSLTTGPHRLVLGDAAFRTWCAYRGLPERRWIADALTSSLTPAVG